MKNLFSIIILSAVCTVAFAQEGSKKNETLVIKTNIYCDHCLQCGSCGENITMHILQENPGVKDVKIDPKANTITVAYNTAKTTADKIRTSVNNAGFDADDKKAPAEAYNKLDGCCKAR